MNLLKFKHKIPAQNTYLPYLRTFEFQAIHRLCMKVAGITARNKSDTERN